MQSPKNGRPASRCRTPRRVPGRRTMSAYLPGGSESEEEKDIEDEIEFQDVKLGEKLAEGQFGEVYRGRLYGQEVAVKVIKGFQKGNMKIFRSFMKEINILKACRHPNIVEYLGACCAPKLLCIITEFYQRGSLAGFLQTMRKEKKTLSLYWIVKTTASIANGVHWLHKKNIIHRDLKPENVLLAHGDSVRICDFGVSHARLMPALFPSQYQCYGTPFYMAPEVISEANYGVLADVYSIGVLIVGMLKRGCPYDNHQLVGEDDDHHKLRAQVVQGLRPCIPKDTEPALRNIIKLCFRPEKQRISCDELVSKLQNMLLRLEVEEQDLINRAEPALAALLQDKLKTIETLQMQLGVTDKALQREKEKNKENGLAHAADRQQARRLTRDLAQTEKKLLQLQRQKGGKKGGVQTQESQVASIAEQMDAVIDDKGAIGGIDNIADPQAIEQAAVEAGPGGAVLDRCAQCSKAQANLPPFAQCARCKCVVYCTRDCQVAHWKRGGHKQACA